jgi:hypothetical protein
MPYFCSNFFSLSFSNYRKTLFKMATLTFCVGDQIFFICYLKNHMTFFGDFGSKLFGNILKIFLICCSNNFFWNHRINIPNASFYLFQVYPRFVSLLLFILWIIIFETKLRFGRNPSKPSSIQNYRNFILPKLAKLVSRPIQLMKKNIFFDVPKFRVFRLFSKF